MEKIAQSKVDVELINKNSRGITMTKENVDDMTIVTVRDLNNEPITRYEFKNVDLKFKSEYLNWQNLDCCGGWAYSKETLINQLKEGRKPFGNVVLNLYKDIDAHLLPLIEECSNTEGLRVIEIEDWAKNCRAFAIMRDGCLSDHIDLYAMLSNYHKLGLSDLSSKSLDLLDRLMNTDMSIFATKDNPFNYDFINPNGYVELIFTGLLLGYPIESTADRLGLPML